MNFFHSFENFIWTALAKGVGAGVCIRGDRVGGHDGVAVVSAAAAAAGDGEHAAHSEGGGAGAGGSAALAGALGGSVAGAVVAIAAPARIVGEGDHIEDAQHLGRPVLTGCNLRGLSLSRD